MRRAALKEATRQVNSRIGLWASPAQVRANAVKLVDIKLSEARRA